MAEVKLVMTWDIQDGREREYIEFAVGEFGPGLLRLGLRITDAWYTQAGAGPQVTLGGLIDSAEAALRTGLTLRPKDPSLLLSLSSVRIEQGDRWEALRLLNAYDQLRRNQNRSSAALEQTHWMVVSELRS